MRALCRWYATAWAGIAVAVVAGAADGPAPSLARLFPREADVVTERAGLVRLELSAEVLGACRPDLSDLRLFDRAGRELAYLVEGAAGSPGVLESRQQVEARVLEAAREDIDRGNALPRHRESYEIATPAAPPHTGSWMLVVGTNAPEFVVGVDVLGLGARGEATSLVERASLFRMRSGAAEKLRLALPPLTVPRVRVVLESEGAGWLDPSFRFESATAVEMGAKIAVPLVIQSVRHEGGRTVIELERPRGVVPGLLRLTTSTGTFDRRVEVHDEGPGASGESLGIGRVFRVEAAVPVGESDLPLRPAAGSALRVEIDDGDSPPLADLQFAAVIPQPALVFAVEAGDDGADPSRTAILRFGGGRAHRPRYDITALLPPPGTQVEGERASAVMLLADPNVVAVASLGPSRANPHFDGAPALAFAMRPGAEIDRGPFRYRRALVVPAAPEGLSRLTLEPADLAVLGEDLADLRVADGDSRQWPYLLDPAGATSFVALTVLGPELRAGGTLYRLTPPVPVLAATALRIETEAAYFDRQFRVEADSDGAVRTLASGRLTRAIGDHRPLSVALPAVRAGELRLEIQDHDDAPLALGAVLARVNLPTLYLTAPAGSYDLLLGAPDQARPSYELERVRDIVLAAASVPMEADALGDNPAYSLAARFGRSGAAQVVVLWVVLLAAALALVVFTLRLARAR